MIDIGFLFVDKENSDDPPPVSGDATEEEIEFLKALKFKGGRPARLYYDRELQNLREPLHFSTAV